MELNKEYHQIILPVTRSKYDLSILSDKVVDKVTFASAFANDFYNELIILFTDKTYIAITIETDEDEFRLNNSFICSPEEYHYKLIPHRTDSYGNIVFEKFIQNRIDCGIWDLAKYEIQELIDKEEKEREENEYKYYLRLKEKFENA